MFDKYIYGTLHFIMKWSGKINSWAIRWCYHQFKYNLYSVHPTASKIKNIGLSHSDATHTNEKFNRFKTILETNQSDSYAYEPAQVSSRRCKNVVLTLLAELPLAENLITEQFTGSDNMSDTLGALKAAQASCTRQSERVV